VPNGTFAPGQIEAHLLQADGIQLAHEHNVGQRLLQSRA
jgi:hypothetical protein